MIFKIATLGKFATIQGGHAYKSGDFQSLGKWPVLKIKNVRVGSIDYSDVAYVSDSIAEATSNWKTKAGDVLISMTGSGPSAPASLVGRVGRVRDGEPVALINQRVGRLAIKDGIEIHPSFLYYVLSLKETQQFLVSNATGSANQVNISAKTIEAVPCPDVDFQTSKRVSNFLDALDNRIALLRETNQTLESIAQSLFKSWFIDFDPVYARSEGALPEGVDADTAGLFPDAFEETELGLVPKGWRYSTVQKSFILTMGQSPPGSTYSKDNSDLPFYQGCTDFGFRFPTQRMYCSSPTRLAETGDTLVSVRAPVGDVNMAIEKCCIGRGLASVRHPKFQSFTFYAISNLGKHFKNFDAEGTIFGSINKADFQSLPVIDAPLNVITKFENIAKQLDLKIIENECSLRVLTELRDSLLPRLISGQLRIADAEVGLEKAMA